ncbi:MAG: HAD-IA family hydrolase [Thiotrichales bacterium]|jgi:phosphoglycolate phosphatase|nr:HAD-IA family hydrolase [Thiotrichales bacterium]
MNYQAVLFDLDGTLCDTALDFTLALNRLLEEENLPARTLTQVRNQVSNGALAIIEMAFPDIQHEGIKLSLRNRMIDYYKEHISWHTRLYPGMALILSQLKQHNIPWGVVSNKPELLTKQIINALSLDYLPHSIIGGDTLSVAKPHPEPLHLAANQCGVASHQCLYIGDHYRDVVAAKAAQMKAVAVTFGYLSEQEDPYTWGADVVVDSPYQLARFLGFSV